MAKPQEKIKYRGATYILAEPPKQITYRGAKYVLAAKTELSKEERAKKEQEVDQKGRGRVMRAFHLLPSLTQAFDSYQTLLGKAQTAATDGWWQARGGLKQISDAGYDDFLLELLKDNSHVFEVLNNFADSMGKSLAIFEKAQEFKELAKRAGFAEGLLDVTTLEDVYRSNKSELDSETKDNLRYIKDHWPQRPLSS